MGYEKFKGKALLHRALLLQRVIEPLMLIPTDKIRPLEFFRCSFAAEYKTLTIH